jgi:predicted membrane channel-forming protein YqfA (hemolysin III family)
MQLAIAVVVLLTLILINQRPKPIIVVTFLLFGLSAVALRLLLRSNLGLE